jgi:hypothetical protein
MANNDNLQRVKSGTAVWNHFKGEYLLLTSPQHQIDLSATFLSGANPPRTMLALTSMMPTQALETTDHHGPNCSGRCSEMGSPLSLVNNNASSSLLIALRVH